MIDKKSAVKTMGFIFIAMLSAKVLGQLRDVILAYFYGAGPEASAYFVASQIPISFFDMILGSAVSSAFIPVFNEYMQKDGLKRAEDFANRFYTLITVITTSFTVIGIIFAPNLIRLVGGGLPPAQQQLATGLLIIMFPIIIFIALAFTTVGILQSLGEYKVPAAMSIISSGLCIVYFFTLNSRFGIIGLAATVLIGWLLQFIIQLPATLKFKLKFKPMLSIKDEGLKKVGKIALPVLLSTWVVPVNTTVNMALASYLDNVSGVATLNYANRLYIIVTTLFATTITNFVFPHMSKLSSADNKDGWSGLLLQSIRAVFLVVLPVMALVTVLSEPIIRLIYGYNKFGEGSIAITSTVLFYYAFGIIGYGLLEVLTKALYSMQKSKVPILIALLSIVTNIVFSLLLSKAMGLGGLGLAASLSVTISAVFALVVLSKKIDKQQQKTLSAYVIKLILISGLCAITALIVKNGLSGILPAKAIVNRVILLVVPAVAGILVYIITAMLFKINEVLIGLQTIESIFKYKKGGI